jgi:hypothetical protein
MPGQEWAFHFGSFGCIALLKQNVMRYLQRQQNHEAPSGYSTRLVIAGGCETNDRLALEGAGRFLLRKTQ